MDEFLRINWRATNDLSSLEHKNQFISEEAVANSLVYKSFEDKSILFGPIQGIQNLDKYLENPQLANFDTFIKSCLDTWAHEHCLKALKVFQSGKDPSSYTKTEQFYVDTFNKFKSNILQENALYQSHVHKEWLKLNTGKFGATVRNLMSYGQRIWKNKWERRKLYPQFYKQINTINMTFDENESIIDYKCVTNVLDLGSVAKFTNPNLNSACHLDKTCLPPSEDTYSTHSNSRVSDDKNVARILEMRNDIDLVIPLSGLKCIADGSDLKKRWIIPFSVQRLSHQKDGEETTRKVVFIDKPFSQYEMSYFDLNRIAYKRLIKTNLCKFEAINYNTPTGSQAANKSTENEYSEVKDKASKSTENDKEHKIHQNVSYKVWNIKKTDCQNNLMKSNHKNVELNILVRSKLDACEFVDQGGVQPVIIRPKLEPQLRFGARIASKEELSNDWTSLFFIPFSNLYRIGTFPGRAEVIYVEKCNIQKIAAEAQNHYQFRPNLGLGILEQVFEALVGLETGNYLLQHLPKHGAFMAVLKETNDIPSKQGEIFNFHDETEKLSVTPTSKNWLPIDVNFILPSFDAANRMPGMFTPRPSRDKFVKNKKKKATR